MDEVAFHREPPSNIPTMVTAFSGWIDAGEAATDAMRFLVRQLAAEPLAAIDLEDFVDFTQVRPVVRLTAEGRADHPLAAERVLALAAPRAPRRAAPVSGPGAPAAVAHLRHGAPGRRRALWRAADRVAGGDVSGPAPYPAPARHGQQHRPPLARPVRGVGDGAALALRRPDRHCQCDVGGGAAPRHGVADRDGPSPPLSPEDDESGDAPSAADRGRPACSTWSWMCPPSMRPCRPFGPAVTRQWRRTPRPRPMYGNWSRPMTRRGTRRRTHAVTTTSTRSS